MLESLRDTIYSVQTELTNRVDNVTKLIEKQMNERKDRVEKLRVNVAPTLGVQRCSNEAIQELVNTRAGSDLLLKYQLSLDQMNEVAEEGVRLANLCSTRMGRAQQMCKERSEAVMNIDNFLRNIGEMDKKIKEINRQVDKLQRFCDQTELAFTHLDALCTVVRAEEEVDLVRSQSRLVSNVVPSVTSSASVFPPAAVQASDAVREHHEEVMLEEFLSTKP